MRPQNPAKDLPVRHDGRLGRQARPELPALPPVLISRIIKGDQQPVHQVRPAWMTPPVRAGGSAVRSGPREAEPGSPVRGLLGET